MMMLCCVGMICCVYCVLYEPFIQNMSSGLSNNSHLFCGSSLNGIPQHIGFDLCLMKYNTIIIFTPHYDIQVIKSKLVSLACQRNSLRKEEYRYCILHILNNYHNHLKISSATKDFRHKKLYSSGIMATWSFSEIEKYAMKPYHYSTIWMMSLCMGYMFIVACYIQEVTYAVPMYHCGYYHELIDEHCYQYVSSIQSM